MIYAIIAKLVRPLRMRHTVVLGDIEADIPPPTSQQPHKPQ